MVIERTRVAGSRARTRSGFGLCKLAPTLVFAICIIALSSGTRAVPQVPADGVPTLAILASDETDLLSLSSCINDAEFSETVDEAFSAGPVTGLVYKPLFVTPSGDRLYRGSLRFGRGLGAGGLVTFFYLHDAGNVGFAIPPDILGFRCRTTRSKGNTAIVIPDFMSYEFLAYVFENQSEVPEILDALADGSLLSLTVDHSEENSVHTFSLHLEYSHNELEVTGVLDGQGGYDIEVN